jgi:hypothetical protein
MDAGRHHDCARDRGKRPAGLPRRQPTRPGDVLRPAPGPQRSAELRPTHLPRLVRPTLLPELGPGRGPRRRRPANGGRERPRRQAPTRTRRRAVHPKLGVPPPAGKPTTSALTAPVSNTSTITSSAISNSPTRASTSEPNPDSPSPSTQQNQTPNRPRHQPARLIGRHRDRAEWNEAVRPRNVLTGSAIRSKRSFTR